MKRFNLKTGRKRFDLHWCYKGYLGRNFQLQYTLNIDVSFLIEEKYGEKYLVCKKGIVACTSTSSCMS